MVLTGDTVPGLTEMEEKSVAVKNIYNTAIYRVEREPSHTTGTTLVQEPSWVNYMYTSALAPFLV